MITVVFIMTVASCGDEFCEISDPFFEERCGVDKPCEVDLKEVFDFEWDKLYFFGSWSYPDEIEKIIGFDCDCEVVPDGETYVVFTKGKKIVKEYNTRCYLTFLGGLRNDKNGVVAIDARKTLFDVETRMQGNLPNYYLTPSNK
ncbi:hypothetical protein [Roseivirga misakiensis]|uniref:hypothetical protein n=1 Tax=Roseivirga misakiensis TaxID=1563681 RepID=UPI00114CCEFF|nr:hypothetical protein [Roseivirga misakiensis]